MGFRAVPGLRLTGLTLVILVFIAVLIPSHQLTPAALLASLTILVFFGRITARGLPLILLVVTLTWMSYMAMPFLAGHVQMITAPFGAINANLRIPLTNKDTGTITLLAKPLQFRCATTRSSGTALPT